MTQGTEILSALKVKYAGILRGPRRVTRNRRYNAYEPQSMRVASTVVDLGACDGDERSECDGMVG